MDTTGSNSIGNNSMVPSNSPGHLQCATAGYQDQYSAMRDILRIIVMI